MIKRSGICHLAMWSVAEKHVSLISFTQYKNDNNINEKVTLKYLAAAGINQCQKINTAP